MPDARDPFALAAIRLGETATALVADRGEPLLRQEISGTQGTTDVLYLYLDEDGHTKLLVLVARGNVVAVRLRSSSSQLIREAPGRPAASPQVLDVALGSNQRALDAVREKYGGTESTSDDVSVTHVTGSDGVRYSFAVKAQTVDEIYFGLPASEVATLAPADEPVLHGATSLHDAVVVRAPDEDAGVGFEHLYVDARTCGHGALWTVTGQALLHDGTHSYDRLDTRCTDGSGERSFYFDITGYFGKI